MTAPLAVRETEIPGLLIVDLVLHGDARGWFKENWQRAKMVDLGLPDFGPVQHSIAHNERAGVTRGFHAEPWDKFVSITKGKIFGAWVDLRPGSGFGRLVTVEVGPETAVFVPRGVANSYQTLQDDTTYSYLVNDHWTPEARSSYSYVNLADPTLHVPWPIPLAEAIISDADRDHPNLADASPVPPRKTVIIGASGQVGRALQELLPDAVAVGRDVLDLSSPESVASFPWSGVGTIINAGAYTAVDAAETHEGRRDAWALNTAGPALLARIAKKHRCVLVHVSSDYVFDGSEEIHTEDEPFAPLGVYGQSKAAGDLAVAQHDQHYIVRTSWVIGDGHNFVRTMANLAARAIQPAVVNDQYGRLTFAADLAAAIRHLIATGAAYGTYNVTSDGPTQSWYDIACDVFELSGRPRADVSPTSTDDYGKDRLLAPRPVHSTLDLRKIKDSGFTPRPAGEGLREYLLSGHSRVPERDYARS